MWYSDPTIVLPGLLAIFAFQAFILMLLARMLEKTWLFILFAAVSAAFTAFSSFGFTFGYYLRHVEEVNKWIGIM